MSADTFVVITRSNQDGENFKNLLEAVGARTYALPTITVVKKKLSRKESAALTALHIYDYLIFTSSYAVSFFCQHLKDLGIRKDNVTATIVAVGPTTATALQANGLSAHLIPSQFNAEAVSAALQNVAGKKILIPRSKIAPPDLIDALRGKGALVTEVHLYTTLPISKVDPIFCEHILHNRITHLTFTSPSCVAGFPERVKDSIVLAKALSLPVICIGPRTAEAAREFGFTQVSTAELFAVEGIVQKLQELDKTTHALS